MILLRNQITRIILLVLGGICVIGLIFTGCSLSTSKENKEDIKDVRLQITQVGSWKRPFGKSGQIWATFINGNYLYLACGTAGLKIFDISNPSNPVYKSSLDTLGIARGVFVSGSYAYVADHYTLKIIDISNPSNPVEIKSYSILNFSIYNIYNQGNYAYIAAKGDGSGTGGLFILDISNPFNPINVGYHQTSGEAYDVHISGSYAYVAAWNYGLYIFDIFNPEEPTLLGTYNTWTNNFGYARGVNVSGNYAYVATWGCGLLILNISIPSNPVLIDYISGEGYNVSISGNYAYIADGSNGLKIIDISNPANPIPLGTYDTSGSACDVSVTSNYAYIADWMDGLKVIDVSNTSNPIQTCDYNTSGEAYEVYVTDNYAYVADGSAGLRIIDISNPSSPILTGSYDTFEITNDIYVSGNYAYIICGNAGLKIIDISNPTNPTLIGTYDTTGNACDVFVSGNYVYITSGNAGLEIINISNPSNPYLIYTYDPGSVNGIYVYNNYAYLGVGLGSKTFLHILDITNPSNPSLIGTCDSYFQWTGGKIHIYGNYACVVGADGIGSELINISNPSIPVAIDYISTEGVVYDVQILGNYVFTAFNDFIDSEPVNGCEIFDISNPINAKQKGFFTNEANDYGDKAGIYVHDNKIFLANYISENGLLILQY